MTDVIYYNIQISNINNTNSGKITGADAQQSKSQIQSNNTLPILAIPEDYVGSIIRFAVPCFNIPLIQFIVQTPITIPADVNKGIYSFTLEYNGTFSSQTFYIYIPQVENIPPPSTPSQFQDFSSEYYFLYNYGEWIVYQNTALKTAFTELQTLVAPALATAIAPFFNYDPITQLISLYADKNFFDQNLPAPFVKIYFNNVSEQYFNGFIFNDVAIGVANGADSYFKIRNFNNLNISPVNNDLIIFSQEFVSLGYLSPLKNIIISTNMNIVSEIFFISNTSALQNSAYLNVITDFIPDLSNGQEAGIGSKIFIYNAPSLFRVFNFVDKNPLYSIGLTINWTDTLNNIYPLTLSKGTVASIKMMFIKKSFFDKLKGGNINDFKHTSTTHNIRY